MHWGVRRYQNEDGSLTDAGRKRYNQDNFKEFKKDSKHGSSSDSSRAAKKFFNENQETIDKLDKAVNKYQDIDRKWNDSYQKSDTAAILYGENSKQYKKTVSDRRSLEKKLDKLSADQQKAFDEMMAKGSQFIDEHFGDYKNKNISGLNVRYGRATVQKLFYADIRDNWWKHTSTRPNKYGYDPN